MSRESVIQAERATDPEGLGYTFNDVDDAALMNSLTTGRTIQRTAISNGEFYEAIDKTEYAALGAADQKIVDILLGIEALNISPTSKTRADILSIFGGGTTTRANLIALVTDTVSRGVELGVGKVHSRDLK